MSIQRPDWGPPTTAHGGRDTPGAAPTPASEIQIVEADGESRAHTVEAEDGDSALYRKLLADGVFTPEELGRHYGLSEEEIDALSEPLRSRVSIDKELAEIEKARRTDRHAYFQNEALQARERELLKARDGVKAARPAEEQAGELDMSGLAPELVEAWEKEGGVAHNMATARGTAQRALDELDDDEQAALTESFDALPASAQTEIVRYIAIEPANWRPANEAAVEAFASTPEGQDLIGEWGDKAAKHVGVVQGRIGLMLQSMPAADRDKAEAFFDALTAAQAKAVLRALAGG